MTLRIQPLLTKGHYRTCSSFLMYSQSPLRALPALRTTSISAPGPVKEMSSAASEHFVEVREMPWGKPTTGQARTEWFVPRFVHFPRRLEPFSLPGSSRLELFPGRARVGSCPGLQVWGGGEVFGCDGDMGALRGLHTDSGDVVY